MPLVPSSQTGSREASTRGICAARFLKTALAFNPRAGWLSTSADAREQGRSESRTPENQPMPVGRGRGRADFRRRPVLRTSVSGHGIGVPRWSTRKTAPNAHGIGLIYRFGARIPPQQSNACKTFSRYVSPNALFGLSRTSLHRTGVGSWRTLLFSDIIHLGGGVRVRGARPLELAASRWQRRWCALASSRENFGQLRACIR